MSKLIKPAQGFGKSTSRRNFLATSGIALATTGLILAGCDKNDDPMPTPPADAVDLGSGDVGILNYAYALEQLEAAFYTAVMASPYGGISSEEGKIMEALQKHEVAHRDFFKAALGSDAIQALEVDFSSIDFSDRASVLMAAQTFEDLGVAAYNGAGNLIQNVDYLLLAGKIVSVEARHAAAIRQLIGTNAKAFAGDDVVDSNGLDRATAPTDVLMAAAAYLTTPVSGSNLPS
ncbi:Ferritin-like domain-containing protein [Catalinimonas alkaloidigena]|uniref:Ferritin-like domain-containing protein n=1 Tax=Catalinimonas alkaloidigena TaxID=1075417 RepID=A0A1G9EGZ8_9BACT|nr:ferritin-like domain-containing protein [Catalinimonas alkaloidigena]SDK75396.1 Ferritin-like domain-containing protein [Catalinimonas alkaloidigena]